VLYKVVYPLGSVQCLISYQSCYIIVILIYLIQRDFVVFKMAYLRVLVLKNAIPTLFISLIIHSYQMSKPTNYERSYMLSAPLFGPNILLKCFFQKLIISVLLFILGH
ncbi:hypothetical protein L9F63_001884, partial [Diploptera punctata]